MKEETETQTQSKPTPSIWRRCYDFLSGFGLATSLLLLLGVLTWLATLEMVHLGLNDTLQKYFNWKAWVVIPEINEKALPLLLPGGYWVCALLTLNLTLGGIVRARKGWSHAGNLIAHAGIILMLVAGGVAHHFEERGNMAIAEGSVSDVAQAYHEYVIEIAEIDDEGKPAKIHVVRGEYIDDLNRGRTRTIRIPDLPFDLEVGGYLRNARPVSILENAPRNEELVVDGYYLREDEPEYDSERNMAGCYVRLLSADQKKSDPIILSGLAFYPYTVESDGRPYTLTLRKRLWPMPFTLRLDEFTAEYHPGTKKPSKFISEVTRIEDGADSEVSIEMNEPMRYDGITVYQQKFGSQSPDQDGPQYSVLEVVRNPADKWPEYALYIVTVGMGVAFLIKLMVFLNGQNRKRASSS